MHTLFQQHLAVFLFFFMIFFSAKVKSEECRMAEAAQIGNAIGVLFGERVLAGSDQFIDAKSVVLGFVDLEDSDFPDDSNLRKFSAGEIEEAERVVKAWKAPRQTAEERYIKLFRQKHKKTGVNHDNENSNGILVREITDSQAEAKAKEEFEICLAGIPHTGTPESFRVCHARLRIDEIAVCDLEKSLSNGDSEIITYSEIRSGVFAPEEVIMGWREVFDLVDNELLTGRPDDTSPSTDEHVLIEVLIPPALAYGKKGLEGSVKANQTLRFLMGIARSGSP